MPRQRGRAKNADQALRRTCARRRPCKYVCTETPDTRFETPETCSVECSCFPPAAVCSSPRRLVLVTQPCGFTALRGRSLLSSPNVRGRWVTTTGQRCRPTRDPRTGVSPARAAPPPVARAQPARPCGALRSPARRGRGRRADAARSPSRSPSARGPGWPVYPAAEQHVPTQKGGHHGGGVRVRTWIWVGLGVG